jgi:hypothetical protein
MLPLLPFAAGLLAGAAAIKLWRNESTRAGIGKAQDKLRQATASGLSAIQNTSAAISQRLAPEAPPAAAPEAVKAPPRPRKARVKKVEAPAATATAADAPKKTRARKVAKIPAASREDVA